MKPDKLKILQSIQVDSEISSDLRYGGTERVVFCLNQTYHELGCESLVAGTKDSDLGGYGKLIPTCDTGFLSKYNGGESLVSREDFYEAHFRECLDIARKERVDVVHDHPGIFLVGSEEYNSRNSEFDFPIVTTLHAVPSAYADKVYKRLNLMRSRGFPVKFISISNSQKLNFREEAGFEVDDVVYNGIPIEKFHFKYKKQDYLFWMGWISESKGTDLAVRVACDSGRPLILAGIVTPKSKNFYEQKVKPYLTRNVEDYPLEYQEIFRNGLVDKLLCGEEIVKEREIIYVGPVNDRQKSVFYQNASCFLLPNREDYREGFGLVMAEAMACGTPVVGPNCGSVPEIVVNGKTGYVIDFSFSNDGKISELDYLEQMIEAVSIASRIDPLECKDHVDSKFSRQTMAKNYLRIYGEM